MAKTNISWTAARRTDGTLAQGYSFNPWIGCTKVSEGCKNCYAAADHKFKQHFGPTADRHVTSENYWKQPLKWNKKAEAEGVRYKVFCGSMCDVFEKIRYTPGKMHENKVVQARDRLWSICMDTPWLDKLLLTKRPENISNVVPRTWLQNWPEHVWIGVSVENQEQADRRIPELLNIPAKVRFLSVEPMLNWISIEPYLRKIDWLICGAESGKSRREFRVAWAESLANQCLLFGVPFFMKQDGAQKPGQQGRIPNTLWNTKQFPNE